MRCPQCNRWPQLEQLDPDSSVDLNGDSITGDVRIILACAECGTEIKDAEFNVDIDVSEVMARHDCPNEDVGTGWFADVIVENTSRQHPPNARRRKTFYGFDLTATLKCNCGEVEETFEESDEVQASHMNELS
jgi:hypothetical protein